jgi:hypothetical protein
MGIKDIAADLQLAIVEADPAAEFSGQSIAALVANPESDIVADDRGYRRNRKDDRRGEAVGMASVSAGDNHGGLARERDAQALDADQGKHGPITIVMDEVTDIHSAPDMELVATRLVLKTVTTTATVFLVLDDFAG